MQTLDKRNATIITAVLGVLFGCAGILACIGGVLTLLGPSALGPNFRAPWLGGLQGICTAAAFISIPVVFYMLLLQGRSDNGPSAAVPSMEEVHRGTTPSPAMMAEEDDDDLEETAEEEHQGSTPSPAMMADATFIEQSDDPSMKATIVGSGMAPEGDDGDDEGDE